MSRSVPRACLGSLLVGLTLIQAACGGDNSADRPSVDPGEGPGPDPFSCSAAEELELAIIQDFELGLATGFYTNADGSEGSEVNPPAGSSSPQATEIAGGRCGESSMAFRMTGAKLSDWGMVFGTNFAEGPRDLSRWDGVAFWARRGASGGRTLFFSVFDPGTDPSGGECESDPDVLAEKCDAYGAGIGMHQEWRLYLLPFDELRQRGFGVPTRELLTQEIIGLNWAMEAGDWDVWIDDVALYRDATPQTAVGGSGGAGL